MKILLVAPPYQLFDRPHFPVGIAYISSVLKKNGFNIVCHNNILEKDWAEAYYNVLAKECPDVLGLGALTPSYAYVKKMLAMTKAVAPNCVTVLGGGILGSEPDVFDALGVDIGVLGEGEETSLELMQSLKEGRDIGMVRGIMHRLPGGRTVRTAARPFINDLDSVPFPDYEGFNFSASHAILGAHDMVTSRGCPFHCTFCFSALGRGRYRTHSIDYVIREINHIKTTYGVRIVGLMDEVFALRRDRIYELCEKILPLNIQWYAQLRVGVVDAQLLERMREAGCYSVYYGLESMSTDVLRSMNKKITPVDIERTLELTYQSRMSSVGNFIFGDPVETTKTAWETLRWWVDHRHYFVNLGKIDCWPGTKIYHDALERGVITDKIAFIEKGCPITNLTQMPWDEFMDMLKRVWALHEGLLWSGRLLGVDYSAGNSTVCCLCPHCGEEVVFTCMENRPMHHDRHAHRLPCSSCTRYFDVPLRLPPVIPDQNIQRLFEEALNHRDAGRLDNAMECLFSLFEINRDHPVAVILGASICLAQGMPGRAKELVFRAIRNNPASPYLQEWAALCCEQFGDIQMANIFMNQAILLSEHRSTVLTEKTLESLDPMEHLYHKIFPCGIQQFIFDSKFYNK